MNLQISDGIIAIKQLKWKYILSGSILMPEKKKNMKKIIVK